MRIISSYLINILLFKATNVFVAFSIKNYVLFKHIILSLISFSIMSVRNSFVTKFFCKNTNSIQNNDTLYTDIIYNYIIKSSVMAEMNRRITACMTHVI